MKVRELELRYGSAIGNHDSRRAISDASKASDLLSGWIGDSAEERFVVLLLDGRHRPLGVTLVSKGTLTASLVHPREVFKVAIAANAQAVIIAHNHPSGDSAPSSEDKEVTRRLIDAGKLLGIPVLDHIVLGDGEYYSFKEDRFDF